MINWADDDDDSDDSDEEPSSRDKWRYWYMNTFDMVQINQALTLTIIIVCAWMIAYSIFGDSVGLYSDPFCLLVLFGTAKAVGVIFEIIRIPPSLGMLAMGIILKNVGFINLTEQYLNIAAFIRKLTLLSITLPATFSLDPVFIKERRFHVIVLAIVPSLVHVCSMCAQAYFLLNLTLPWSLLLGVIQTAAAAPIVIPCLFELEKRGYGNDNGVLTLITSSIILDAVWSIIVFGLIFDVLTRPSDDVYQEMTNACVAAVIGVSYGVVSGFLAQYVPDDFDWYVTTLRTLTICMGSLLSLFGSHKIGYPGAGVLGWSCMAYIANLRWRRENWSKHNPVRDNYKLVWRFFEPISFSLVGIEIIITELKLRDVLFGLLIIITSTTIHVAASMFVTRQFGFSTKHSILVAMAWIGKGTIQAGIAPLTLDYAREVEEKYPELTNYAKTIITVTVISIIISTLIMKIMFVKLGPKLLDKYKAPTQAQLWKSDMMLAVEPDLQYRRVSRRTTTMVRSSLAQSFTDLYD